MDPVAHRLVEQARIELCGLDEDRDLVSLDTRYPRIVEIARQLEEGHEPPFEGLGDTAEAVAFLSREYSRISRGEGPVWEKAAVMASLDGGGEGAARQAYAITLALVECGGEDIDIRDLLRTWFSRYGMPPEG